MFVKLGTISASAGAGFVPGRYTIMTYSGSLLGDTLALMATLLA